MATASGVATERNGPVMLPHRTARCYAPSERVRRGRQRSDKFSGLRIGSARPCVYARRSRLLQKCGFQRQRVEAETENEAGLVFVRVKKIIDRPVLNQRVITFGKQHSPLGFSTSSTYHSRTDSSALRFHELLSAHMQNVNADAFTDQPIARAPGTPRIGGSASCSKPCRRG